MDSATTTELSEADLVSLHRASIGNARRLTGRCGCFQCLSTFPADMIRDLADEGQTALCPVCGIDAVIGPLDATVSEPMLQAMHHRWFDTVSPPP